MMHNLSNIYMYIGSRKKNHLKSILLKSRNGAQDLS